MTCNEVRQHWMLYLDSEGDAELHFHISDHLGMCPACAEWLAQQERFEKALADGLAASDANPKLWQRVLSRAGIVRSRSARRRSFLMRGALAAAALFLAVTAIFLAVRRTQPPDLARMAANLHEQILDGVIKPDFVSTSDQEVDRYLKKQVPFRVHCPPRSDANFAVKGAGVRLVNDRQQVAYILGHVGEAPVSILVLDRTSVASFPNSGLQLCREGNYQVASGIVHGNLVFVIGTATADKLERLLNAYGTYPDG